MTDKSFNDTHPECEPDEVWVTNWWSGRYPHPAGRLGEIAYTRDGVPIAEASRFHEESQSTTQQERRMQRMHTCRG